MITIPASQLIVIDCEIAHVAYTRIHTYDKETEDESSTMLVWLIHILNYSVEFPPNCWAKRKQKWKNVKFGSWPTLLSVQY